MHHGLEENSTDTSDTVFIEINGLKKPSTIYSPPLLSEYIAWHKRYNVELAKAIVKKGTCAQDIFIKRYPELAQYWKEEIPKPKQPNNFLNNHHFSELRYLQLFFKGLLIPYFINETISMFQKTENYQHSIRYELEGTRLNCIYFLKDFKRKIFYYFSETCSDSLIDATRSREYSFNKKEVELFKKRYARDNKDAEGKNAYEYFKQFSVLKAIPINQDMNEWLKEIALQLSNDNQQQSSEYRKNRIADLEKYINENNITIPEDTEKWLISLMNMLEAPIKITIQNNADINNGPGRIIHLFETIKKRIAVIFVFIKTAYQKFKILIKGMY